jgi:hypothetical protein
MEWSTYHNYTFKYFNKRLTYWTENYYKHVYIEPQAGFKVTVNLFSFLTFLLNYVLTQNKKLFCVFVYFYKAFDYLVRPNIWHKLFKFGVSGKLFSFIQSMYAHVLSRVKLYGETYLILKVIWELDKANHWVLFLFLMYLNDLENNFHQGFRQCWYRSIETIFIDVCWWYCSYSKLSWRNTDKSWYFIWILF